jgi:NTE family protein
MSHSALRLTSVQTFTGLSPEAIAALETRLTPQPVSRGDVLVAQGDEADAFYVVVSGRFAVEIDGDPTPVTEISRGATIGEIAFFTDGPRTATVRAIRESVVVGLTRSDFAEIVAQYPDIWRKITATLAQRLAAETRRSQALLNGPGHIKKAGPRPRTLAMVSAGHSTISPLFLSRFIEYARRWPNTLIVSLSNAHEFFDASDDDSTARSSALNGLEDRADTIVFVADNELSDWSKTVIRQADEILLIADSSDQPIAAPVPLSPLEKFAGTLHRPSTHRLVFVHQRSHVTQGTRHWLQERQPFMHHHVAIDNIDDIARLWRFIRGEALGFVACGGGAYAAAHIGLYKAFLENGITFDMFGGTSGGAAMAAAFAEGIAPDEIEARVHCMFIDGHALSRYTLPRYSLVDHTHFDTHLKSEYGHIRIEDLWKPYYAVAVDLTDSSLVVLRDGLVWEAIRASAAIPGVLPPYYTRDGSILVDGSVMANVPIETMHALKLGPNIVVSFKPPESTRDVIDYDALPGRRDLLWRTLTPFTNSRLPVAPSAGTVLVRSLMANRSHFEGHLTKRDWLLVPPTPNGMGAMDWRRHKELTQAAYRYAMAEIANRGTIDGKLLL